MSDFTPATEQVRAHYVFDQTNRWDPERGEAFDRWLAGVKAEVLRDAAAEIQDIFLVQRTLLNGTTYEWLRDRADRIEKGEA